jgi:hypothetical protein
VSSLNDAEFIQIVGHYNHIASGSKEEIDPRLKDRGYSEAALNAVRTKLKSSFSPTTSQGIRFKKHFSNFKYPLMNYILGLHDAFERGILPFSGSYAEQPAKVIEVMNLLSSLRIEHEIKAQKEAERKASLKNGRHRY